jgi:hypothetical protein
MVVLLFFVFNRCVGLGAFELVTFQALSFFRPCILVVVGVLKTNAERAD